MEKTRNISLWMLRRLAPRAKRIIERRKSSSAALAAYERTLVPAADRFIAAYDTAARYQSVWHKERAERMSALDSLSSSTRSWRPLVASDVAGVGLVKASGSLVADDVIREAEWLLGVITDHRDGEGKPLVYGADATAELGARIAAARKEASESEAADTLYQQYQATVRETAAEFETGLKALRRTLAVIFGRSDRDYQKLRAQRAAAHDEDDDVDVPVEPEIQPAPSVEDRPVEDVPVRAAAELPNGRGTRARAATIPPA